MQNAIQHLPQRSRVAIVRLRSLGDCVLTTPALALLNEHRPDLQIAVVVEERFAPVFQGNPAVARILEPSLRQISSWRPRLTINLHGGTRSALLTIASLARFRAGFVHFRGAGIYNLQIPSAQEILNADRPVHTAEHLASAMFYLGVPPRDVPPAKLFAVLRQLPKPCAVIHPFASHPSKTWPAARFIEIAAYLRDTMHLDPVIVGSTRDDFSPFGEFRTILGAPLSEVMSIVKSANLFVGNDSGPAHMAAAFGVPAVVLYGTSDPVIWAPWRVESQVLSGDPIENITTEQVADALELLRVAR